MAGSQRKLSRDAANLKIGTIVGATVLFFTLTAAFGCGGSEGNVNTVAVNSRPTANTQNAASSDPASTAFGNANSFNTNISANRPMDESLAKMKRLRTAANRSGKPIPSMNSRPAPEDSTISSTLTDVARETRIWKKHPVLAKVEKVFNGGEGSIKVYLRNGKVIDLPGSSITQLDQISAAGVLALAGVAQPNTRQGDSTKMGRDN